MAQVDHSRIRSHVQEVLESAERSVERAYLFGSQARGDAREDSDIDIALVDESFADVPMYRRGIWFKREWDYLGVGPLELYCLTPDEYDARLGDDHETVWNIEYEGIWLLEE